MAENGVQSRFPGMYAATNGYQGTGQGEKLRAGCARRPATVCALLSQWREEDTGVKDGSRVIARSCDREGISGKRVIPGV